MKLLFLRHAPAEDRIEFSKSKQPDNLRPLTDRGRKKMRKAAPAIFRMFPNIDLIACSQLTRAQQTAKELAFYYPSIPIAETESLNPDSEPDQLYEWLRSQEKEFNFIALVGHEPDLTLQFQHALGIAHSEGISFRKCGVCVIEFAHRISPGLGQLCYFSKPNILRRLGKQVR